MQMRLNLPREQRMLVLATSESARGGIAAVVKTYRAGGLFDAIATTVIATHTDGSAWAKLRQFSHALIETISLLLRRKVALVHAHVSSGASFWRKSILLQICRVFGVPTIFHLHSGKFDEWVGSYTGSLRHRWIRHTLEASDEVIVLTTAKAAWMRTFAPKCSVRVVGNPVPVPPGSPVKDKQARPLSAEGGRVLYLGWIHDVKGSFDLLHAWTGFREACPGWRLVVGGNGEVERFLAEAEKLGVRSDIDFLGWVSGEAKDRALRDADVFILPSYNEGMPVSILEAMTYGAAVLTTPVGGVPDMMREGVHGLWMQPGDIPGMRQQLVRLAKEPRLRHELAQAAYVHVVEHNSVEAIIRPLMQTYSRLTHLPLDRGYAADN